MKHMNVQQQMKNDPKIRRKIRYCRNVGKSPQEKTE